MKTDTLLVHAGEPRPRAEGAVAMPIYQSSTFEETEARGYHDIRYARLSNTPSHDALHGKLAALEGAEAALATASGMAAVSAALFSSLRAGDHLLAQDGLYGGTHDLIAHDLPRLGIEHTFVPGDDPAAWERALTPRTRAFYVESMTNPLVRVLDLPAAASFARSRGLVAIIDNTFATPLAFRPLRRSSGGRADVRAADSAPARAEPGRAGDAGDASGGQLARRAFAGGAGADRDQRGAGARFDRPRGSRRSDRRLFPRAGLIAFTGG